VSIAIFTEIPRVGGRDGGNQFTAALNYSGGGEQRAKTQSRKFSRFTMDFKRDTAGRALIDEFFDDRDDELEAWFWRLSSWSRAAYSLPAAVAAQTVYPIPTGKPNGGDYPLDNVNAILKLDGSPVTKTVQTEARTMTASVGATGGELVTIEYDFYRLFRLEAPFEWTHIAAGDGWFQTAFGVVEVEA